jgi:hypothetical protein
MISFILLGSFLCVSGFVPSRDIRSGDTFKLHALTWQEEVDEILNIDTACDNRRTLLGSVLSRSQEITSDVASALQDQDIKKIAPPSLAYGKALVGLQAIRRQFLNDILPGALTKGLPKLIEEGPKFFQELIIKGPEKSKTIFESVREISQDPSMVQTTVEDIRRELRNVVKSTPEGLDGPTYDVIKDAASYQVRFYSPYSVCSTLTSGPEGSEMADPMASGKSFNLIAEYIFGENFAMTTPVISGGGAIEFVLPKGVDSVSAPI